MRPAIAKRAGFFWPQKRSKQMTELVILLAHLVLAVYHAVEAVYRWILIN